MNIRNDRVVPSGAGRTIVMTFILAVAMLHAFIGPSAVAESHPNPTFSWTSGSTSFNLDHRYSDDTAHCRTWWASLNLDGATLQGWQYGNTGMQVSHQTGSGSGSHSFQVCAPVSHSGGSDTVVVTAETSSSDPSASKTASVTVFKPGVLEVGASFQTSAVSFDHPRPDNRNKQTFSGTLTLTNTGDESLSVTSLHTSGDTGIKVSLDDSGEGILWSGESRAVGATLEVTDRAAEGRPSGQITASWDNSPYSGALFAPTDRSASPSVSVTHPVRLDFSSGAGPGGTVEGDVEVPSGVLRIPFTLKEHYNFKPAQNIAVSVTGPEEFVSFAQTPASQVAAGSTVENELLISFPLEEEPCLGQGYTWSFSLSSPALSSTSAEFFVEAVPVVGGLQEEADRLEQAINKSSDEAVIGVGERILAIAKHAQPEDTGSADSCDNQLLSLVALLVPMGGVFVENHNQLSQHTAPGADDPDPSDAADPSSLVRSARDLATSGTLLKSTLEEYGARTGEDVHATRSDVESIMDASFASLGSLLEGLTQSESLTIIDEASLYSSMAAIRELNDPDDAATAEFRAKEKNRLEEYHSGFAKARAAHLEAASNHEAAKRSVAELGPYSVLWNPFQVDRFRQSVETAGQEYQSARDGYDRIGQSSLSASTSQADLELRGLDARAEATWRAALVLYAVVFLAVMSFIALRFFTYSRDLALAAEGDLMLVNRDAHGQRSITGSQTDGDKGPTKRETASA